MISFVLALDLVGTFVFALAGSSVVAIGSLIGLAPAATALTGAALCFALRMLAIHGDWQLPRAKAD